MSNIVNGLFGSSAKTDRGNQLGATQGEWNIFNYGLPTGQAGQTAGSGTVNKALGTLDTASSTLNPAQNYFQSILSGGRTQAAQTSAPAINATLAGADAQKQQQNNFGTGRTGGLTAASANRDVNTGASVDNIINTTLQTGRATGATGLQGISQAQTGIGGTQAQVGDVQLRNALQLLGLSEQSVTQILDNATKSRPMSQQIHDKEADAYGSAIGTVLAHLFV